MKFLVKSRPFYASVFHFYKHGFRWKTSSCVKYLRAPYKGTVIHGAALLNNVTTFHFKYIYQMEAQKQVVGFLPPYIHSIVEWGVYNTTKFISKRNESTVHRGRCLVQIQCALHQSSPSMLYFSNIPIISPGIINTEIPELTLVEPTALTRIALPWSTESGAARKRLAAHTVYQHHQ